MGGQDLGGTDSAKGSVDVVDAMDSLFPFLGNPGTTTAKSSSIPGDSIELRPDISETLSGSSYSTSAANPQP